MKDKLWSKRINFQNALQRLEEAINEFSQPGASKVIRDGLIQRFEFTYELAWKTTKAYLEDSGIVEVNSPKAVIKEAFAQKLLHDEKTWLLMLQDRNMTSHLYKEEMAEEIAIRISSLYLEEFKLLLHKIT